MQQMGCMGKNGHRLAEGNKTNGFSSVWGRFEAKNRPVDVNFREVCGNAPKNLLISMGLRGAVENGRRFGGVTTLECEFYFRYFLLKMASDSEILRANCYKGDARFKDG